MARSAGSREHAYRELARREAKAAKLARRAARRTARGQGEERTVDGTFSEAGEVSPEVFTTELKE